MLSDTELRGTFDDWADIIEVNNVQQTVSCGGDPVWQACIEAINISATTCIPLGSIEALSMILKSESRLEQQGETKIYRLFV